MQAGKTTPSTDNSLCSGGKKEYGMSMEDEYGPWKMKEVTWLGSGREPWEGRLDKEAEAIKKILKI